MSEDALQDAAYRWHQIMFRLDTMDEVQAAGLAEDEAHAFDRERAELQDELTRLESELGASRVSGLKADHELDRAYDRQRRQMDEERGQSSE